MVLINVSDYSKENENKGFLLEADSYVVKPEWAWNQ